MTYGIILCLPSLDARGRKVSGTAAVQAKLFERMPFQFNAEVERMASGSGICRSMFICLCACAHASFCVCASCLPQPQRPYHLLTHLLPSKTEPPPLIPHFSCLLIKGRSSHSCPFPFFSLSYPPPHRAGLARVQQPPLPLYHHVA